MLVDANELSQGREIHQSLSRALPLALGGFLFIYPASREDLQYFSFEGISSRRIEHDLSILWI
jgi:hypothetical protein